MENLTCNPKDRAYKLQEKLGLGGFWKDVNKCYSLIKEYEAEIIGEHQDKLSRRNLQIKSLKEQNQKLTNLYNELVNGYNEARGETDYRTKI